MAEKGTWQKRGQATFLEIWVAPRQDENDWPSDKSENLEGMPGFGCAAVAMGQDVVAAARYGKRKPERKKK